MKQHFGFNRFAVLCLLAAIFAVSCNDAKRKDDGKPAESAFPIEYPYDSLMGVYSGDFGGSIIHLSLRMVTGRNATGYTVHKGLKRNFSGPMEVTDRGFHFLLKEPGNNPYDGVFDIKLDTTYHTITGNWTPKNNKDLKMVKFSLKKEQDNDEIDYGWNGVYKDSTATISFNPDGQCVYAFYEVTNGVRSQQLKSVKGSWHRQDETYYISWAQNTEFTEGTSALKIDSARPDPQRDYMAPCLKFNGRVLARTYD